MARVLRPKEARVIQVLLARLDDPVAVRQFEHSGMHKSTFFTIRQRAIRRGWVTERYVPDPDPLGVRRVVFQVGWPFAESSEDVARAWEEREGAVVLWRFRDVLFSVVWERSDESSAGPSPDRTMLPPAQPLLRTLWTVEVDADSGGIPVYFDFEGAWARWAGSGKPITYPTPLGCLRGHDDQGPGSIKVPRKERLDALQVLGTPSPLQRTYGRRPAVPAGGESKSESNPPAPGWVHRCAFPDFPKIPPMAGSRRVDQVIFVTGLVREGWRPQGLMEALFRDAEIAPFLVAYDQKRLLMGLLAPRPPDLGGHAVSGPECPTATPAGGGDWAGLDLDLGSGDRPPVPGAPPGHKRTVGASTSAWGEPTTSYFRASLQDVARGN